MNIALIISIPIILIIFGFFMLKFMQLGIKWGMQAKEGVQPELKNPIAPIVEGIQQRADNKAVEAANKYSEQQIEEYSPFFQEVD
jgi:hypothetical protein